MRYLRTLVLAGVLALTLLPSEPADAQACRTHTWVSDEGKTPNGWTAQATDGCHRVTWTSSIGQAPCEGAVTFQVTRETDPWAAGFPQTQSYCEMRAVHEANLYFVNLFKASPGTRVTVQYAGD